MAYSISSPAGQAVQHILDLLPNLVSVAVVDTRTGMSLASYSGTPGVNPDMAANFNAGVVRQKQQAIQALALTDEVIEDILITLTTQLHLIMMVGDGSRFLYLAVRQQDTSLGTAREALGNQARLLV